MSKAFTKDDGPEAAPVLRRRAPLPAGAPNYVTPRGLRALRAELARLAAATSSPLSGAQAHAFASSADAQAHAAGSSGDARAHAVPSSADARAHAVPSSADARAHAVPSSADAQAHAAWRAELEERVATALVVAPPDARSELRAEAHFGAIVHLRAAEGRARVIRIVGVDEADAAHGLVAFTAPLARALLGRRAGDVVSVRAPRGEEDLEIVAVAWDD